MRIHRGPMRIVLSAGQWAALRCDDPDILLLVRAGFYLGLGIHQLSDLVTLDASHYDRVNVVATALDLGLDETDAVTKGVS